MVTFRLKKAWIPQNNSNIYLLLNEKVQTCKEIDVHKKPARSETVLAKNISSLVLVETGCTNRGRGNRSHCQCGTDSKYALFY